MDERRKTYLLKLVRGKDFRRTLHAIAELRAANDPALANAVTESADADEQRAFQSRVARIALERGVQGLVDAWGTLGAANWRAGLISEVGQFLDRWAEPAVNELALAALEDSSREVQIRGVWALLYIREPAGRKAKVRSASEQRYLDATEKLRGAITQSQRSRMTRALGAMVERHRQEPYPVLPQLVELLGYTANKDDKTVIAALEALRSRSSEPHTVSYERLDKSQFEWFDKLVLAKKGVAPEEMIRIKYTPTGLLDHKVLETALARISQKAR
jgi:hypothetical protein